MTKGLPFRMRLALALGAVFVVSLLAAPLALAQSPDDIPGFDQLPIPGGEDPADDPADDPAGDDDSGDGNIQVDAPGGGVDTGAGGLATDHAALTLVAAAAVASTGAAALVARRRTAVR